MKERPIIAITMGDPASIGPEISVKALSDLEIYEVCKPILVGDKVVIEHYVKLLGLNVKVNAVTKPSDGIFEYGNIDLIDLGEIEDLKEIEPGKISAKAGSSSAKYIEKAVELAKAKEVRAIATAPINKEAWKLAGVPHIGHTEMLGDLTGINDPLTMFQVNSLRIFFLTRHVSLRKACDMIKKERVLDYIERCTKALRSLGLENPRLAVAALNPHGGEHGLFGDEEMKEIEPAIKEANERGFNAYGPIPADSVFWACLSGKYDAVLSLYHDQGHIAAKTLDFYKTVSVTLGLPFLRTSVDHGTAMDIAGKGIANAISMIEAIKVAASYAEIYKQEKLI
ncbi:MAG: 4-hydroxythreonine-4-phosphate dehydrogenase PdxA [Synergistetes bacterium]|nr:4-hydroxythreonine-4-phosphate dehydrogenase PdxA [Synergistota bacterium]MDW8191747.1 4-hydroxythreonine-4-phosphate dehydrogenase PdxA [Synergistota bacterium]